VSKELGQKREPIATTAPASNKGSIVALVLQLFGAGCLVVVVLTHVFEARHLFPWMGWGLKHSAGHYLDLSSAIIGLALFPTGCLLRVLPASSRAA
jgi:hypothetical protein